MAFLPTDKTPVILRWAFLLCLSSICLVPSTAACATQQQIDQAVNLLEQQDYVAALGALHELEQSLPDPARVSRLLAVAYMGRGYQLLASNEYAEARDFFREGRRYDENDVRLWQGEAMAWYREGQYPQAVSVLDEALALAPEDATIYHLLGVAYYADGRMAEALDALKRAEQYGGGDDVVALRVKVQREWQLEREMTQEYRGHFQLAYVDGGNASDLAGEILAVLEDAYAELGAELNFYPNVSVPVLLYSHSDFAAVTRSPDWAGAVYDGKIRLPLAGLSRMNERLAALLYHEYMHVIVHFMAKRHAPVWLNEGLAELAGRRLFFPPLIAFPGAVESGQLLDWQRLEQPFALLDKMDAALAYEQSYALVRFLVERYGWFKVAELLERLGTQKDWRAAVEAVYRDYGLDWPAILREWQAELG